MHQPRRTRARLLIVFLLPWAWGCQSRPVPSAGRPATPQEQEASRELSAGLTKIINDADIKYRPLEYDYAEDLLDRLDRLEAFLAGGSKGTPPRYMPKLSEAEELDHFRESIRRWEAKSGTSIRAAIEPLKAEVAARKPGEARYYPAFQKRFSEEFDDFIKLEVAEIRERRNRAIHEQAAPLLSRYRDRIPGLVREHERTLNSTPYDLPTGVQGKPAGATSPAP